MDQHIIEAAVERAMRRDMQWGSDDCSLWVCDIVQAGTGVDLAAAFRGRYRSAAGAFRVMKKLHGGGIVETAIAVAAAHRLKPAGFPWRGDLIGVVSGPNGPALALFNNGAWLGRSATGMSVIPARDGVIAWEVPPCRL